MEWKIGAERKKRIKATLVFPEWPRVAESGHATKNVNSEFPDITLNFCRILPSYVW